MPAPAGGIRAQRQAERHRAEIDTDDLARYAVGATEEFQSETFRRVCFSHSHRNSVSGTAGLRDGV
jgi:hypothetical protein